MSTVSFDSLASIDLGSNSFHMIVASVNESGGFTKIDDLRESVRLGRGLTEDKILTLESQERAFEALGRFQQRIQALPKGAVRIVGTNTLRKAQNSGAFIKKAEKILGHPIEVISGREEARLIYLGVAHGHSEQTGKRFVIDIGGGSTELILGKGMKVEMAESLSIGCVALSLKYFADGKLLRENFQNAIISAKLSISPVFRNLVQSGWENVIGCSGTIKAIRRIVLERGWSATGITLSSLHKLKDEMVEAGHIDVLDLDSLKKSRRPVLAGGLAALIALFEMFGIERMEVSKQALREGLLYDLLGRIKQRDVRGETVTSLITRWEIDRLQAERVQKVARFLFEQVREEQGFSESDSSLLCWASSLHELGLQISHRRYHRHGAYVLANADLPGFSFQEQQLLATLVLYHRRKFKPQGDILPELLTKSIKHLCVMLRLAVLLCRHRADEALPSVKLLVSDDELELRCLKEWLEQRSLLEADLEKEKKNLSFADIEMKIVSVDII